MRSSFKRSAFAAGLALALPLGLAACGGDEKPPKEDVIDGMSTILEKEFEKMGTSVDQLAELGVTQDMLDDYYSCIVDDIYDDVEAVSLRNIADGKDEIASSDRTALTNATTACSEDLGL